MTNFIGKIEYEYNTFSITLYAYLCELIDNLPILTEHIDSKWCNIEELKKLDFAEADKEIVKDLIF